ncbi:hypothetical protein ACOSQ2_011903 [Xanthoceras sorbifolium]
MVSSLKTTSGTWNEGLICANFLNSEAATILNLPQAPILSPDILYWHDDKLDQYSIKSRYKIASCDRLLPSSFIGMMTSFYRVFMCHHTLESFFGRSATIGFLLSATLLAKMFQSRAPRNVPVEVWCPLCHKEPETTLHALWGYKDLKSILHSDGVFHVDHFLNWSNFFLAEFHRVKNVALVHRPNVVVRWLAPNQGCYKGDESKSSPLSCRGKDFGYLVRGRDGSGDRYPTVCGGV